MSNRSEKRALGSRLMQLSYAIKSRDISLHSVAHVLPMNFLLEYVTRSDGKTRKKT